MPAPFKPVIRDELDVSNFAEEFTEMDPTYSPAALPQNCDRIFQVGGCLGMLDNQTIFCCDSWFCCFQTGAFLCGPCRSRTGQHYICICFVIMFVWALVAGSVKCWHGWKIALYIIHFLSLTIFDILHSNWSNQVKFWMSSKGCCKSTWVCLCALVFKLTKGSFIEVIAAICSSYWSNRCEWLFLM